jgi:hypothetical protein
MSQGASTESAAQASSEDGELQILVTELVPDGRAMIPVQVAGHTVLAVHPSHISHQLADELQHHFAYAQHVGLLSTPHLDAEVRPRPAAYTRVYRRFEDSNRV